MPTINVNKAANIINLFTKADTDFIIAISGARGIGKSTLMCQMTKALKNGWYDFAAHHIYTREDLEHNLKYKPDESIICSDESITALFKREWHDDRQIEIVKLFNMFRDKRHTIFLLMPHFWDMDTAIRNSLIIKVWIYVYKLGEAVVFTHDNNPFTQDPWNVNYNLYLWRKGHIYKSPNYLFNITWQEMPPKIYAQYKAVKAIKREAASKKEKTKVQTLNKTQVIKNILTLNPNATGYAISKLTGGKIDESWANKTKVRYLKKI